ncbi:putative tetratricopeptide-like helical domain superfamily [Dioscorea sansibarensis]
MDRDGEPEFIHGETLTKASSDPFSSSSSSPVFDLSFDADELLDLAARGQWRSLLDNLSHSRSVPPHVHLSHLAFHALSLHKLRRFPDSLRVLQSLVAGVDAGDGDPFDSLQFRYESYPDVYPAHSGSMLPFAVRYLHADLPQRIGDRSQSLDRLYSLLDFVRQRITADGGDHWRRREAFIVSSLCCNHFSHREFDVALALLRELLERDPSNPVLLSRLGHVQLQIGDLDGARATFARVEKLVEGHGVELENLAARNRALGHLVNKDYASAVREYDECIERDPADVVALNNKALCLLYSRDLSDSIKVLEGALERVPTAAVKETLVVNLCSMYELAYVNHGEVKKSLNSWIARVAPDDFDPSCTRI